MTMTPEQIARMSALSARLKAERGLRKINGEKAKTLRSAPAAKINAEAAEIRAKQLEQENLWMPVATVVTGQYQHCQCCGTTQSAVTGYFRRDKHRTLVGAQRLVQQPIPLEGLPLEKAIDGVVIAQCIHCIEAPIVDDLVAEAARQTLPQCTNQLKLELQ